jgi:hypothetical protein
LALPQTHALRLLASLPVFDSNPFEPVTLFAAAKKKPDKIVGNNFKHLEDGPQCEIQGIIS